MSYSSMDTRVYSWERPNTKRGSILGGRRSGQKDQGDTCFSKSLLAPPVESTGLPLNTSDALLWETACLAIRATAAGLPPALNDTDNNALLRRHMEGEKEPEDIRCTEASPD